MKQILDDAMENSEKEKVRNVLSSVKPYINAPSDLESLIEETLESSEDLDEFKSKLEDLTNQEEDPSSKADLRIFLNKLRSVNR